ncbi:cobalamin B12-binding domain-containing protein [Roseobacteraceae bacterium S113]
MKTREAADWPSLQSVEGLALEVVSLLKRQTRPYAKIRVSVLDKLITQILTRGLFDAERVAAMMRAQRLTDMETVDAYIPNAARRLGQLWSEDIVGFAEVSIGTARLQALAHEISGKWTLDAEGSMFRSADLTIATLQGEDHTLGAVTLCTLLRRKGHNVDLRLGVTPKALLAELKSGRQDALMLSCSRPEGLASLARVIQDARNHLEKTPVLAVGGVVLEHAADIKEQTGADLVTRDINQVLKLAMSRRKGRISVVR